MERGEYNQSYAKEQIIEIRAILKPEAEYKNKTEYAKNFNRVAKELGYFINKKKRLDTHKFKGRAKVQNDAIKEYLVKIKDINEINSQLSGKLTDANAWETKYKKSKSKVKTKALTIAQLKNELALIEPVEVENPINIELQGKLDKLHVDLNEKDTQIASYKAQISLDAVELESLRQELKSKMQTISKHKKEMEELETITYTGSEVLGGFDENNNPIPTKETWKDIASEWKGKAIQNNNLRQRIVELEEENSELKDLVTKLENAMSYIKPESEEQIRDKRINELESVVIKSMVQQEELGDLLVARQRDKIAKSRNLTEEDASSQPKR